MGTPPLMNLLVRVKLCYDLNFRRKLFRYLHWWLDSLVGGWLCGWVSEIIYITNSNYVTPPWIFQLESNYIKPLISEFPRKLFIYWLGRWLGVRNYIYNQLSLPKLACLSWAWPFILFECLPFIDWWKPSPKLVMAHINVTPSNQPHIFSYPPTLL